MAQTPRPDHPWYGRNNHVKTRGRKKIAEALLDREIERTEALADYTTDLEELNATGGVLTDPSVEYVPGGLRRLPVRYYDSE